MHKIACFGDNCVDFYDQSQEAYYGGNPVNVAVYTKRLGFHSSYIGVVGKDSFGDGMKAALIQKGVDCSHLHQQEGETALTHVEIVNGDRVFGDYEEGVMATFSLNDEDISFISSHDLAITGLWGHCENQLSLLKENGILLAFAASDRPEDEAAKIALPFVDILFFSNDFLEETKLKEKMKELFQQGPRLIIATRGEKGSLLYDGTYFLAQGIYEIEVVDTMGAGDSFIAGFLNAYLEKKTYAECMDAGAKSSLVTLSYKGAW